VKLGDKYEILLILDMTPCKLIEIYRRFGGTSHVSLQGTVKTEAAGYLEVSVDSLQIARRQFVRDSSVNIATRYGLDGSGIESRYEINFSHPSRTALGPTQPPIQWVPGLFLGVKRPGRGVDHQPPSNAEEKERVELYLYSPSGPSWPVLG
jgi:hypothetical protein